MNYNRGQWMDSFEGRLALLRPHLTNRVLSAMSLQAWIERGTKDIDPVEAANALSAELDKAMNPTATSGRATKK